MRNIKKINSKNKKAGFTVVETLFGIAIFVLIFGAITLFARNLWIYNAFIGNDLEGVNSGRAALKGMAAEVRTASSGSNGGYAINAASGASFTFYSDIYDNGLKEKVRYFLSGTDLKKGVTIPTGSPLDYTGTEVVTNLVSKVTSVSFDYYDKNYDGTTAPLSSPIDVSAIRLVKITIVIEKDANKAPTPITLSTQVSLRNIKDNL